MEVGSIYNRYAFHGNGEFEPDPPPQKQGKKAEHKEGHDPPLNSFNLSELLKSLGSKKFDSEDILLAMITLLVFLENDDAETAIILALLTLFGL